MSLACHYSVWYDEVSQGKCNNLVVLVKFVYRRIIGNTVNIHFKVKSSAHHLLYRHVPVYVPPSLISLCVENIGYVDADNSLFFSC